MTDDPRGGRRVRLPSRVFTRGTRSDAQWFSYGVNQRHGLRRTNEDKVRAVKAALTHPRGERLSNCEIAAHCGVDEKTVRKYREECGLTSENPKSRPRTGRDGRTINTTNIGKRRRAEGEEDSESVPRPTNGNGKRARGPDPVVK